jgi:hypothetical protein
MFVHSPGSGKIICFLSAAAVLTAVTGCGSPALQAAPHHSLAASRSTDPGPSSPAPPPVSAPPPAAVGVSGLAVDGQPAASGGQVTVTGPAARQVTGRFTSAAGAGDRFFALTTPQPGTASYVQGEIRPAAGGAWAAGVQVGTAGVPDRVSIVVAAPAAAAVLASFEGQPGKLRPIPAVAFTVAATVTITRTPAGSPAPGRQS